MMFGTNKGAAAVAERIPQDSVGIEIGVWLGDSSELFLRRAAHLHLVDPWSVQAYADSDEFGDYDGYLQRYSALVGSAEPAEFQAYYDAVHDSVVERFAGRAVTIHRCTSAEFFARFGNNVDWVYVDGSHEEHRCHSDLLSALMIASQVFGDDYGTKPGVTAAVDRVVANAGVALEVFAGDQYRLR